MLLESKMDEAEKAQQLYQQGLKLAVAYESEILAATIPPVSSRASLTETTPKLKIIQ
jgi:hypothetical protein